VPAKVVVIISANIEWHTLLQFFPEVTLQISPFGNWFETIVADEPVIFFHGGWGKIAAAASTQYAVDTWRPALLVNLGTCGGIAGQIERGTIVLVEKTVVYDIVEQMTDPQLAVDHFVTSIDLSWLQEPYPQAVTRTLLVSADRDLVVDQLPALQAQFGAVAGDWESGAIAWVAARNGVRCLILRGVTDLVGPDGGEAYAGNLAVFERGTLRVFETLLPWLPDWIVQGRSLS
jgi:adenosylhomocysteine nucleosidase